MVCVFLPFLFRQLASSDCRTLRGSSPAEACSCLVQCVQNKYDREFPVQSCQMPAWGASSVASQQKKTLLSAGAWRSRNLHLGKHTANSPMWPSQSRSRTPSVDSGAHQRSTVPLIVLFVSKRPIGELPGLSLAMQSGLCRLHFSEEHLSCHFVRTRPARALANSSPSGALRHAARLPDGLARLRLRLADSLGRATQLPSSSPGARSRRAAGLLEPPSLLVELEQAAVAAQQVGRIVGRFRA